MIRTSFVVAILASCVVAQTATGSTVCVDGPSVWYSGTRNYTRSGIPCQRWDVKTPHVPRYTPKDGGKHNYCRNPDHDINGTWCYTTNTAKKWEYCFIPKCPDDSTIVWTNVNTVTKTTQLYSLPTDAEIVMQETGATGNINISLTVSSNRNLREFWAVTSDYRSNQIFFADYRSQHIGVYNVKTKKTKYYLEGMGRGIESMAYDWITGNLYMSDSTLKWIMVSTPTFDHYNRVFKTDPDAPYGLTLHAKQRYLFFATYKSLGSQIYRTDMAGKNPQVLFKFPDIFEVTGMTIDYADDKLYWTDFTGYGSLIMSSNLDGTNKIQKYYAKSSIYWGIASYMNHLYVTDVHMRLSQSNERNYYVWWISKTRNQRGKLRVVRYELKGKPRGITVMSKNVEYSQDKVSQIGSCGSQPPCDHICLPRINATRECLCSVGFKQEGTSCKAQPIRDNFMLVSDAGQGKVFQLPLAKNVTSYVSQTLPFKSKPSYFAADLKSNFFFWSDEKERRINKATSDGMSGRPIEVGTHARSLSIEPNEANLYYINDETQEISFVDTFSRNVRTIMTPNMTATNFTDLKQLTLDLEEKYVYWTDSNSTADTGKVWRMRYDGSQKEVVFDNLNWPHAISYNPANKSLYFSEAKLAKIYVIPTSSLKTVNGSIPTDATMYDFSQSRRQSYIAEIQGYKNTIYFYDRMTRSVEEFDTTKGVSSRVNFGPQEFFRVRSLVVWSKLTYLRYIAPLQSYCRRKGCRQICVSMSKSKTDTKCLCKNGFKSLGTTQCIDAGTQTTNQPPVYGSTCPLSDATTLTPCESTTFFNWVAPEWTDDRTPSIQLNRTYPRLVPPVELGPGQHEFTYTATDSDGAVGYCRFILTVKRATCDKLPQVDKSLFIQTTPLCGPNGKSFNITCRKPNTVVHPFTDSSDTFAIRCLPSGHWSHPHLVGSGCPQKATTAPAPTVTGRATTTTAKVTTPKTLMTTISTTQPPTRPPLPINTSTSQRTTTKLPATLTTKTPAPVTTLSTTANPTEKTPVPVATTSTTSSAAASAKTMTPTPKDPTITTSNSSQQVGDGKSAPLISSNTLSVEAIAGIAILVIVCVVVVTVIVVIQVRQAGGSFFPELMKLKEDKENLNAYAYEDANY